MQDTPKRRASVDILQSAKNSLISKTDHQLDADDLDAEEETDLGYSVFQRGSPVITGKDSRSGGAGPRPSMRDDGSVPGGSQAARIMEYDSIGDATGLLATNRPELTIAAENSALDSGVSVNNKSLFAMQGKSSSVRKITDQQLASLVGAHSSQDTPAAVRRASIMLKAAALLTSQEDDDNAAEKLPIQSTNVASEHASVRGRSNSRMEYLFGQSDLLSHTDEAADRKVAPHPELPDNSLKTPLHPAVQLPAILTADLPQSSPLRAGPKTPSFVPPLLLSPGASPAKPSTSVETAGLAFKHGKRRESISLADPLIGSPEPTIGSAKTRRQSIPPVHPGSAPTPVGGWDTLRGVVREPLEREPAEAASDASALASVVHQLVRHNTEARVSRSSNASEALLRLRRASIDRAASDEIQAVAAFTAKRLSMTSMTPTNSRAAMHLRGRSSFVVDPAQLTSQPAEHSSSAGASTKDKEGAESDEEDVEVLNSSRISALNTQRLTARHALTTDGTGPLVVATVVDSPVSSALATTVIHDKLELNPTSMDAGSFDFPSPSPVSSPGTSVRNIGNASLSVKFASAAPERQHVSDGASAELNVRLTSRPETAPSPVSTLQHVTPQSTEDRSLHAVPIGDRSHAAVSASVETVQNDSHTKPHGPRSNRASITLNNGETLFLPFPATFTSGDALNRTELERPRSIGQLNRNPRCSGFGASTQAWAAKYDTTPTLPAYPKSARQMVIHTPSSFSALRGRGGRTLRKSTTATTSSPRSKPLAIQPQLMDMSSPMALILHEMCTTHLMSALRYSTVVEPPWDGYNIHAQDFADAALLMARELAVALQPLHACISQLSTSPLRTEEFSLIQPLSTHTTDSTATHVLQSCSASFNTVALQRIEERRYTSACGILVLAALIYGAPNEVPATNTVQKQAIMSMTDGLTEASAQVADTVAAVALDPIRCLLQAASGTSQFDQLHAESCSVISAVLNNTACIYSRIYLYSQAVDCLNAAVAIEAATHADKAAGCARPYTLKNLSLVYACVAGDLNAAASILPSSGPIVSEALHPQVYAPLSAQTRKPH
jgi:hypothetical protein